MEQYNSGTLQNKPSKHIIGTPSPTAKSTFFYMQESGHLKINETAATQRQNLDSFLIAAVLSGKGELTVGKEHFSAEKYDCFFIDCRTAHFYKSSEDDPWELLWIHFNGSTSRQYYEHFTSQFKNVFRSSSFECIVSVIYDIININEHQSPYAEITTSKKIMDLLTFILTSNSYAEQPDTALKQKLMSIHNYIEENFNKDLSLEKLSSDFYISKYYMTREYKKIYGKTIFQHVINLRINYAKQLLRFSDKSTEEIAILCGFNDQSYFARQFKKSENVTCLTYRKIWRE